MATSTNTPAMVLAACAVGLGKTCDEEQPCAWCELPSQQGLLTLTDSRLLFQSKVPTCSVRLLWSRCVGKDGDLHATATVNCSGTGMGGV